ncbi:TerD family protein [Paenibacillus wulumuqiensis]|uniref:TerD family protein n=1 Tax=Paenibacillus wulumuqiensis TaxID=1567107 RepID=UPI000619868C|nr:TerD family protein [Paenibacillus wulumuqiensis]
MNSVRNYRASYQSYLTRQDVDGAKIKYIFIINTMESLQRYMKRNNMQTVFNKFSPLSMYGDIQVLAQLGGEFYRLPEFNEKSAPKYMKNSIYGKDASTGERVDLFSDLFHTSELTHIIWFTDEEITPYVPVVQSMHAPHLFWNFVSIKGYPLRCAATPPKNINLTHAPKISSLATSVLYRKVLNRFSQYVNKTDLPLSGRVRISRTEDLSGSTSIIKGAKVPIEHRNLKIGIGWKTFGEECLSAAMLLTQDKLLDAENITFFGNKSTIGMTHIDGRELPTEDMEQYIINLSAVEQAGQDKVLFSLVMPGGAPEQLYIRILTYDNRELLRYHIDMSMCQDNTALELGALYAYKEEWRFHAIGNGYNAGMEKIGAQYGISDLTETYDFTPGVLEDIALDGKTFEYHMQDLFTKLGYEVEMPTSDPYAPDYGVDLVITKAGIRTAVQLKCFNNVVPIKAIQEVYAGAQMYNCTKYMVAATNYFSRAALQLADQLNVEIWDKTQLKKVEDRLRSRVEVSPEHELKLKLSKQEAEDEIDIDISAFLVNEHDHCLSDDDLVFYNQPEHSSGCIRLINDTTWEKLMYLNLSLLPSHCERIIIIGSLDAYKQRVELIIDNELNLYHTFEYMPSAVCDTLVLGQFRKIDGAWAFTTSDKYFVGGLPEACKMYGLTVEE